MSAVILYVVLYVVVFGLLEWDLWRKDYYLDGGEDECADKQRKTK